MSIQPQTKKPKPGAELELLVARLEEWLAPKGAKVTWSDHVPDSDDPDKPRQIDITIRYTVGSVPVLIAIECRDQFEKQDVQWIDELIGKRQSLGADKMVAVSRRGFSELAQTKAAANRIELRRVDDITEAMAASWANLTKISIQMLRWDVVGIEIECRASNGEQPKLDPQVEELLTNKATATDTEFGREICSGHPLSIRSLVNFIRGAHRDLLSDLLPNAPKLQNTFRIDFPGETFSAFTTRGEWEIKHLKWTLDMWITKETAPPPRVFDYASMDGSVIQVAQTDIPVGPNRTVTVMYSTTKPEGLK